MVQVICKTQSPNLDKPGQTLLAVPPDIFALTFEGWQVHFRPNGILSNSNKRNGVVNTVFFYHSPPLQPANSHWLGLIWSATQLCSGL